MKFNVTKFALTIAVVWALYILCVGWITTAGWGSNSFINAFSGLYVGYKATFVGSIVGALYGLVYGFLGGLLIALIYNSFIKKKASN